MRLKCGYGGCGGSLGGGVSLWHVKMCSTERGGSSRPQCGQDRGER